MPAPSTSLATLRPDLASSLEEFDLMANAAAFIGTRLFPVINTSVAAGTFGRIPLEQLLQSGRTARNSRSGYSRGDWTFIQDSFITTENGWEEPVDDNDAAIHAEYFDAELISTARAMHIVLQNQEFRVRDLLFDTAVYTGDLSDDAVAPWDNASGANPIKDIEDAARAVYYRTGIWPNALVLSRIAFRNLRNCEEILDRIAASGAGDRIRATDVTTQQLAEVFDLDQIIVAGGSQNLAAKGQDRDIAEIWDTDKAMVCRIANTNDVREPAIGRIFHWAGDGSVLDGRVESYRDEVKRSDIIRVRHQTQEKVIYKELGHLITGLVTEAT